MSARKLMIEAWALRQGVSHGVAAVEVDAMLGIVRIAGWAVVPVEPTEGMQDAAVDMDRCIYRTEAALVWRAMLKAAQEDSRG